MATPLQDDEVCCPDCGAVNARAAGRCWLCRQYIYAGRDKGQDEGPVLKEADDAARSPPPESPVSLGQLTFHLDSLMLTVTLVAVCAGVARLSPGLGIALAVISAPAFVRSAVAARRKRRAGRPLSPTDKAIAFVGSLLVVATVAISAGVAFYLICWVGFIGAELAHVDGSISIGVLLGIVAGLFVAGYVMWRLWPMDRRSSA